MNNARQVHLSKPQTRTSCKAEAGVPRSNPQPIMIRVQMQAALHHRLMPSCLCGHGIGHGTLLTIDTQRVVPTCKQCPCPLWVICPCGCFTKHPRSLPTKNTLTAEPRAACACSNKPVKHCPCYNNHLTAQPTGKGRTHHTTGCISRQWARLASARRFNRGFAAHGMHVTALTHRNRKISGCSVMPAECRCHLVLWTSDTATDARRINPKPYYKYQDETGAIARAHAQHSSRHGAPGQATADRGLRCHRPTHTPWRMLSLFAVQKPSTTPNTALAPKGANHKSHADSAVLCIRRKPASWQEAPQVPCLRPQQRHMNTRLIHWYTQTNKHSWTGNSWCHAAPSPQSPVLVSTAARISTLLGHCGSPGRIRRERRCTITPTRLCRRSALARCGS